MPHSPGVHATCALAYQADNSPSPWSPNRTVSDLGAGSMISSAQLSHDLSCHRVRVGAHCQAGACVTVRGGGTARTASMGGFLFAHRLRLHERQLGMALGDLISTRQHLKFEII